MSTTRIATLDNGYFDAVGDNETTLVSVKDDPPKHRLGVMRQEGWGRSLGCHSFNSVRPSGVEDEVVLIQGKIDERTPLTDLAGEYRIDIKAPGDSSDAGMKHVVTMFHDRVDFKVPVTAPSGVVATSDMLQSSGNGRFRLYVQNDGNLVLYDTSTTPWVALWNTGTVTP